MNSHDIQKLYSTASILKAQFTEYTKVTVNQYTKFLQLEKTIRELIKDLEK